MITFLQYKADNNIHRSTMADGGGNLNDGDSQGQAGSTPVTGIQPPQALVIDSNITDNWKKWQNYSLITNLSRQTEQYQVALLLHTLGL